MKLDGQEIAGAQNDMIYLVLGILFLGWLVYMIFLSNEMSLIIDRLSIKIIELKNKLKQINRKDDNL